MSLPINRNPFVTIDDLYFVTIDDLYNVKRPIIAALLSGTICRLFSNNTFLTGALYGGIGGAVSLITKPLFENCAKLFHEPELKGLSGFAGKVIPWVASYALMEKSNLGHKINATYACVFAMIFIHACGMKMQIKTKNGYVTPSAMKSALLFATENRKKSEKKTENGNPSISLKYQHKDAIIPPHNYAWTPIDTAIISGTLCGTLCSLFSDKTTFIEGAMFGGISGVVSLITKPLFRNCAKQFDSSKLKDLAYHAGNVIPWVASYAIMEKNNFGCKITPVSALAIAALSIYLRTIGDKIPVKSNNPLFLED